MCQSITAATVALSVPTADLPPVFNPVSPSAALVYTYVYWADTGHFCTLMNSSVTILVGSNLVLSSGTIATGVSSHDFITDYALLFCDQPFH